MGHIRLGRIPKSRKWDFVVASIIEATESDTPSTPLTEDVTDISSLALEAAEHGLQDAIEDEGLRQTFFLLTQVALAARQDDWRAKLEENGLSLPSNPTPFDLSLSLQNALDDHLFEKSSVTDISEIAQKAAGETILSLTGTANRSLFGDQEDELKTSVYALSTKDGFSRLGQTFFGNFLTHFLNFYLSRATATYSGTEKLSQIGEVSRFNEALQLHCYQSAQIVHDFCGEWYSKTEWQQGINFTNTSGFLAIAVRKLQKEIQDQRSSNG